MQILTTEILINATAEMISLGEKPFDLTPVLPRYDFIFRLLFRLFDSTGDVWYLFLADFVRSFLSLCFRTETRYFQEVNHFSFSSVRPQIIISPEMIPQRVPSTKEIPHKRNDMSRSSRKSVAFNIFFSYFNIHFPSPGRIHNNSSKTSFRLL